MRYILVALCALIIFTVFVYDDTDISEFTIIEEEQVIDKEYPLDPIWRGIYERTPTPTPTITPTPIPTATPTPIPTPVYVEGSVEQIICSKSWNCQTALRVAYCESSWIANNISWDGSSYGLFQINAIHAWRWPDYWTNWMNPQRNTEYAYDIWLTSGWGPWLCA